MHEAQILISHINVYNDLFKSLSETLLLQLPDSIVNRLSKLTHPVTKNRSLAGWFLLKLLLSKQGIALNTLEILPAQSGKPQIKGLDLDFNISHSGEFAVCAIAVGAKIGIDMQIKRKVRWQMFERYMTKEQWHDIINASNSIERFFYYWTLKESVLKAEGSGLSGNLAKVITDSTNVFYKDKQWFVRELNIDSEYACHVASDKPIVAIEHITIETKYSDNF